MELSQLPLVLLLISNIHSGHTEVPRAVLSVSPQKWLTEGDPVTLICEVYGSSTGWTFSWYTLFQQTTAIVMSCSQTAAKELEETTLSVYFGFSLIVNTCVCVSPPVSLIISPNRIQHFTSVSLSLSCEDQSNSDRWTVRRYTDTGVILESPVHPVTEGDTLTLHCLYKHSTPPNLTADFYKDESLIQSQTTEMIISNISKSHEGFYYCKHPERGESPKSWISVTASSRPSRSVKLDLRIIGVTAGLTVTFLIIVFLVLLWRYRNNKGVRSQSPSSVSQQQNSSQTSEQNQSDVGYSTLLSDSESGPTEHIYAEIEHKSTSLIGKTCESSDTVYSKLTLVTHQERPKPKVAIKPDLSSQKIEGDPVPDP
ncbi:Sialoadhesin [Labeo rohita]|uniref:Sialoadhesin n=1 Tax=Labeo rohita TaxID=84645 RepID=A0ABQ8MT11_LABRO|nr:Sialoadhesin [Labeo rohita]